MATNGDKSSFESIYHYLTAAYGFPVLPSASANAHKPALSHAISDLSLHPTLEALLHLLNSDLPSAHFLCRHMQNEPAWEGMYIHGLLHRIEGDYRNAEAWYGNVADSPVFRSVWVAEKGGLDGAKTFIQSIEKLRKQKVGSKLALESESEREIEGLVKWCKQQFGVEKVQDASKSAWVEPSEEHRKMAAKMLVGGEGWRQF